MNSQADGQSQRLKTQQTKPEGNKAASSKDRAPSVVPANPQPSFGNNAVQAQPSSDVANSDTGGDTLPQIADDTDLIEKEWIDKAKDIVARTAHDPHLQNQEINKMRNDYLKKRYNKVIKQSE